MNDKNIRWISQPIYKLEQGNKCPVCNSTQTESRGRRELVSGKHNKRVCKQCGKYYYVDTTTMQVFYSVV